MVLKCTQNRIFKIFIMVYKGWLWLLPNALTSPLIPPSHPLPLATPSLCLLLTCSVDHSFSPHGLLLICKASLHLLSSPPSFFLLPCLLPHFGIFTLISLVYHVMLFKIFNYVQTRTMYVLISIMHPLPCTMLIAGQVLKNTKNKTKTC